MYMKKITVFISFYIFAVVISSILYKPSDSRAYSYSGFRWSGYPVSVDTGDASIPGSWIAPIANAMSAWNGQTSPFYFNVGYAGRRITVSNNGNNGTIAQTVYFYNGSNYLTDSDTVFNSYYTWSTSGEAGKLDVQNVMTHEFGHWLVLNDLNGGGDTEKTMYGSIGFGETKKRSLDTDDINGINAIYP